MASRELEASETVEGLVVGDGFLIWWLSGMEGTVMYL
jgi:hypothetical protein